MAIDHNFLSIRNASDTNGIGITDKDIFNPANHTTPSISSTADSQDSITYDSVSGGISINTSGFYHIALNLYVKNTTTNRDVTVKFKIDGNMIAAQTFKLATALHTVGTERSFSYFGNLTAGQSFRVDVVASGGTTDVTVLKGTSLTILGGFTTFSNATKITTRTLGDATTEIDPFTTGTVNTNYIAQTSADFTLTGSSYGQAFKYTGASTGLFMAYATFTPNNVAAGQTDIVYRLYKTGSMVYNNTSSLQGTAGSNSRPYESSISVLQQLGTNNTIQATCVSTSGANLYNMLSSSFSVLGVNDQEYLSIYTSLSSKTSLLNAPITLFKSSSYNSFVQPTQLVPTTGITYDTSSGNFTVGSDGFYYIAGNIVLNSTSASDMSGTLSLRKNATSCTDGTEIWIGATGVDGGEKPTEKTISGIFQLSANDNLSLCYNSFSSTVSSSVNTGTSFTIFKVGSVGGGGGGGGGGTARITSFGSRSGGFSAGSFGSPTSGRTVGNGFF
jgi:hypothetical protein